MRKSRLFQRKASYFQHLTKKIVDGKLMLKQIGNFSRVNLNHISVGMTEICVLNITIPDPEPCKLEQSDD